MKLSKSKLSKLHNKKAQTRKQRLVKKKQKERQRGGKNPKSILKTKRKYSRPFNLRYKTLRNIQKRKRDRKHNNPRKIRFLLKGGQDGDGIELTQLNQKKDTKKSKPYPLSMDERELATPLLSSQKKNILQQRELQDSTSTSGEQDYGEKEDAGEETKENDVGEAARKAKAEAEAAAKAKAEAARKAEAAKESSIDEPDCGPGTKRGKEICEKIKGCHYTEDDECLPLSHKIAIDENKKKTSSSNTKKSSSNTSYIHHTFNRTSSYNHVYG